MNTRDLEAFIAVVETGSIVAASTRLNLTQPGVTRRIQSLEALLGTALLDRTAKPLRPTIAGRGAYDQGRRVIQNIADLHSEVAPDREVRGSLKLGIAAYVPEDTLATSIDTLRELYPQVRLHVVAAWSPHLLDQVLRGELDAAAVCLAEGVKPPEPLMVEDLGGQRAYFVAAPKLGVPKDASLADLAQFPWVLNQDGCGFRTAIRRRFDANHLPFDVAVEAPSRDLRLTLVARGLGIGISTSRWIADHWNGRIETIDVRDFQPRIRCWLVTRQPLGRLEQPLDLFREAIAASFGGDDGVAGELAARSSLSLDI